MNINHLEAAYLAGRSKQTFDSFVVEYTKEQGCKLTQDDYPKADKNLPSQFQVGDYVDLLMRAGNDELFPEQLTAGKVTKVQFSVGKVFYDLEFTVDIDHENRVRHTTRIHSVDSAFVVPRNTMRSLKSNYVSDGAGRDLKAWHIPDKSKYDTHTGTKVPVILDGPEAFYMSQFPPKEQKDSEHSIEVVIDLTGHRRSFAIGFFDFDENEWILELPDGPTRIKPSDQEAKWMNILPFSKKEEKQTTYRGYTIIIDKSKEKCKPGLVWTINGKNGELLDKSLDGFETTQEAIDDAETWIEVHCFA